MMVLVECETAMCECHSVLSFCAVVMKTFEKAKIVIMSSAGHAGSFLEILLGSYLEILFGSYLGTLLKLTKQESLNK